MRQFWLPGLASALILGCTATGEPGASRSARNCAPASDPVIGSMIVRRGGCIEQSDESREEAQRRAEAMRDEAQRMRGPRPTGSGGQ